MHVTDVSRELGFIDIVLIENNTELNEYLTDLVDIAPFYVKREDQVKGITHLHRSQGNYLG